jgi:pimeloyl-ACP methyl ester carboxylesterase
VRRFCNAEGIADRLDGRRRRLVPTTVVAAVRGLDTPLPQIRDAAAGVHRVRLVSASTTIVTSVPPAVTTSDGVEIAVHDLGGDGPPMLFAHATGFHGLVFAPLAHLLSGQFHGVALDLRGHGDSGLPPKMDFDWHGFARDVLATVDGLGLTRPFGVGHSGGGAGLLLAEQARPGTFRALYLFEPIVFPPNGPFPTGAGDNPLSEAARRRREIFDSRQEAFDNYASKPPFDRVAPEALRAYVDHGFADLDDGRVQLKCRGETEALVYEQSWRHDAYDHLAEVRCPVTVACGATSDTYGTDLVEAIVDRLPRARAEVVPGVGHFGPLEDPALLASSIRSAFAAEGQPPA